MYTNKKPKHLDVCKVGREDGAEGKQREANATSKES